MKHLKTIAIVGAANKEAENILKVLLRANCHLLLLASDQIELRQISKVLKKEKPVAGISLIDCIRDGCWEADVVVIAVPVEKEKEVAERVKEVVTQKIVISMKIADTIPGIKLQQLLPFSKVVHASEQTFEDGRTGFILTADKPETLQEAGELLHSLNVDLSAAA